MSDWELKAEYDYRFNALMMQGRHNGELSPPYQIRLSDVLQQVPVHELRVAISAALEPYQPEDDVDASRVGMIRETDLAGKVVLDIGGYDGTMAKIAKDAGAERAIVLDNHQYEHYGWEEKKQEGVEYVQGDFMDTTIEKGKLALPYPSGGKLLLPQPDVIIFFNVLYHLRSPWAALDHLRTLLKPDGELLLCTLFRYGEEPFWYLYEPYECNKIDQTVFWGPSLSGIERLLTHTGWLWERKAAALDRCTYRCKPIPNFRPILADEGYAKS